MIGIRRHVLPAGLVLAAFITLQAVRVGATGSSSGDVMKLLHQPSSEFPQVALRVNRHEIAGSSISEASAMAMANGLSRHAAIALAIKIETNRWSLYDEARHQGFSASDAEVDRYLAAQVEAAKASGNDMSDVLQANGDETLDGYAADVEVREQVRRMLTSKKLLASEAKAHPGLDVLAYRDSVAGKADVEVLFSY
jgi:hypothetical protein